MPLPSNIDLLSHKIRILDRIAKFHRFLELFGYRWLGDSLLYYPESQKPRYKGTLPRICYQLNKSIQQIKILDSNQECVCLQRFKILYVKGFRHLLKLRRLHAPFLMKAFALPAWPFFSPGILSMMLNWSVLLVCRTNYVNLLPQEASQLSPDRFHA